MAVWLLVQYDAYAHLQRALSVGPLLLTPALWIFLVRLNTADQKTLPTSYGELGSRLRQGLWLETLGAMSYSIYLCHKPLAYAIILSLGLVARVQGWASLLGITIGLTAVLLTISTLLYIEVENRFRFRASRAVTAAPAPSTGPTS